MAKKDKDSGVKTFEAPDKPANRGRNITIGIVVLAFIILLLFWLL